MEDYQIDNKIKENRGNIIFLIIATVCSLTALFTTKNFLYFIFTILLFISIYLLLTVKNNQTKRRVAMISLIVSGLISSLCLFSYLYSKWILPFTLDIMHLPALNSIDTTESLGKVANVFGIIGLIFLLITIFFLIAWYLIRKKEEQEINETKKDLNEE